MTAREWIVDDVVTAFHELAYGTTDTRWRGVPMQKHPCDLWMQAEVIQRVQPDLIIETGSWYGGSALFYADLCQINGRGQVVSIDVHPVLGVRHPRVNFLTGSSTSEDVSTSLRTFIGQWTKSVLVILDSDHSPEHVAEELRIYAPLVTVGSYLIVEDTNCGGRPIVNEQWAPRGGPWAAVEPFLVEHPEFVSDKECEKFLITMHVDGWLRRVR